MDGAYEQRSMRPREVNKLKNKAFRAKGILNVESMVDHRVWYSVAEDKTEIAIGTEQGVVRLNARLAKEFAEVVGHLMEGSHK